MDLLTVYVILYILAAACFFGYSLNLVVRHVNLLGLGVFFWSLVALIKTLHQM